MGQLKDFIEGISFSLLVIFTPWVPWVLIQGWTWVSFNLLLSIQFILCNSLGNVSAILVQWWQTYGGMWLVVYRKREYWLFEWGRKIKKVKACCVWDHFRGIRLGAWLFTFCCFVFADVCKLVGNRNVKFNHWVFLTLCHHDSPLAVIVAGFNRKMYFSWFLYFFESPWNSLNLEFCKWCYMKVFEYWRASWKSLKFWSISSSSWQNGNLFLI